MKSSALNEREERLKKLKAISEVTTILSNVPRREDACGEICKILAASMRYPQVAVVHVRIGETSRVTSGFRKTSWGLNRAFETGDTGPSIIEIYYTKEMPWDNDPFLPEEEELLDKIAVLLSGAVTKAAFEKLLLDNIERRKELGGIERITAILQKNHPFQQLLQEICQALPDAWMHPEHAAARVTYGEYVFSTQNFEETPWIQRQEFTVPEGPSGSIEICYLKEFPAQNEGPFLNEERRLIDYLAQLIAAAAGCRMYEHLVAQNRERLKELRAINQTTQLITLGRPIDETLQSIVLLLPGAWQFAKETAARISYGGRVYISRDFTDTPWVQRENFVTIDNQNGSIEVFYLQEMPLFNEGSFLTEERDLIRNIARLVAHFLNNYKGRELLEKSIHPAGAGLKTLLYPGDDGTTAPGRITDPPSRINKTTYTVRDILLVASAYETFILDREAAIDRCYVDPLHVGSLWIMPQLTVVSSFDKALDQLKQTDFELVVVMCGSDAAQVLSIHEGLKTLYPLLPVFFLAGRTDLLGRLRRPLLSAGAVHRLFYRDNDPRCFFALSKLLEDAMSSNQIDAPTVLIVEDAPEFYTRLLCTLYAYIFEDLPSTIREPSDSAPCMQRGKKTRLRILLAHNYEEAVHYLTHYQRTIVCLISDLEFEKNGTLCPTAGLDLIRITALYDNGIARLIQTTDIKRAAEARELGTLIVDKRTPDAQNRIRTFIADLTRTFTFRNRAGDPIAKTDSLREFKEQLCTGAQQGIDITLADNTVIPWLKAQGEFALADEFRRIHQSAQGDTVAICRQLTAFTNRSFQEGLTGRIHPFNEVRMFGGSYITTMAKGSLGGKGRGVAFLNALVERIDKSTLPTGLALRTPLTTIIGSGEYERLMHRYPVEVPGNDEESISSVRRRFDGMELSPEIRIGLTAFLNQVSTPIAVRSSSLFEDSLSEPFAGAFETYIIPNSHPDMAVRLRQLEQAVKQVYASLYRSEARQYFTAAGRRVTDERMSVVIQALVGQSHDALYYPHISGVAGSYNFYPVAHMQPDDGFAVIAFGLGVYVVEGRSGQRFSPRFPELDFGSTKDLQNGSQVRFYAVETTPREIDFTTEGEKAALVLAEINQAEHNGSLIHCASVYDPVNDRIVPNLQVPGPRIVDFADILKHGYIPLAPMIDQLLGILAKALESPVEIEFAVDLTRDENGLPSFYLLQVKPLVGEEMGYDLDEITVDPQTVILYSETSLGNGRIDGLTDVVIVNFEHYDRLKTEEMVHEIEYFNRLLAKEGRSYILIGMGRWGTRDKSLGVPVAWSQISKAGIIIEVGMSDYPLEASLGSHFFHNVTAMNVGYIAINENRGVEFIRHEAFDELTVVERRTYFRLLRSEKPLIVRLDGKKHKAIIERSGR